MLAAADESTLIAVRVHPRSRRAAIDGERAGRLLVHVAAPPLEGRANEAVCRLIAKVLRVAPGTVTVAAGTRGRDKVVRVERMGLREVAQRLGLPDP
jgi:uncharacterized protein (TIGR00251 family)